MSKIEKISIVKNDKMQFRKLVSCAFIRNTEKYIVCSLDMNAATMVTPKMF